MSENHHDENDPRRTKTSTNLPDSPSGQPSEPSVRVPLPERIGQFRVKRLIASGGMGTVYEAVQEKPRRTVALKVVRHGVTSRSALRRFEYESQVLARLRHPGIAQVYEAGTHDDGSGAVPFFAMEYIPNARRITDFAKEKGLSVRQRLELFARVCDAVHHGHQKGIIHRDLKPGNILVDSTGEVKIIDFGVARGTDSDLAVTTLQTDIGQLVGTLQYMSPEQCQADPQDIDTRSDVYALGVVLYELLSGRLPYDLSRGPVIETTRVIREQQPARLSTTDATLKGDTETIVLKALEKDRARRYQSAVELAQDIRRYLDGEAIVARPPSITYQLRLFARRNKVLFGATAAVFAALLCGVIVSTALYLRAERARAEAAAERDRALTAERRTAAINDFFKEMVGAFDPFRNESRRIRTPPGEVTVGELMQDAADRVGEYFGSEPELEAEVRETLSGSLRAVGRFEESASQLRQALEIRRRALGEEHPDTIRTMSSLAGLQGTLGNAREARDMRREAYERALRALGPDDPITLAVARGFATSLRQNGDYGEAESLFRELLAAQQRSGDFDARETIWAMSEISDALTYQGKLKEGEATARRAFELAVREVGSGEIDALYAGLLLFDSILEQGRYDEAEAVILETQHGYRQLFGEDHVFTTFMRVFHAEALHQKGELDRAESIIREALASLRRDSVQLFNVVGTTTYLLAGVLIDRGEFEEAELFSAEAIEILRRDLGDENPETLYAMDRRAMALRGLGRIDEAEALSRRVVETAERRFETGFLYLPEFRHHLGQSLIELNRFEEAREQLQAAHEGEFAMRGEGHRNTVAVVESLVRLFDAWGKPEEAAQWREKLPSS